MKVIKIKPSGYCFGVVNAIKAVIDAHNSNVPKPINIYGMLIHNKQVINALSSLGINTIFNPTIEDLSNIKGTIIFTAHGISSKVISEAKKRNLHIINATCRDVLKTMKIINKYLNKGYEVLYIGKDNHPEAIAATEDGRVHLIEKLPDLFNLDLTKKFIITNQTTMSINDIKEIHDFVSEKFPHIKIIDEICNATRRRQLAVLENIDTDILYVVGDKKSNNSLNLASLHPNGRLIEGISDIDINELKNFNTVSVTAGASTPKAIINEVIDYLEHFDDNSYENNNSKLTARDILNLN
ncbi:4-hydroxy-3-methylbut-2-enyl diphosphate reductase [Mycoplasmatota bacterium]|nr:4-hydroxy-3-methylbut-2-enyl diphosphate reductase [Mycoplasmatota bacterium]